MQPFRYHDGQRDVLGQANSTTCADKLSNWVGPVTQYANEAELIGLAAARTDTFLVMTAPTGFADVSHRGGLPGFLRYDAAQRSIHWTEYLGDGMFASELRASVRAR